MTQLTKQHDAELRSYCKKCYDIKVMSGSTQIILEQFKLKEIPSLPRLILCGLNLQNQALQGSTNESKEQLSALLADDIALYARSLGAYRSQPLESPCVPAAVLGSIGADRVQALVSQSALQSCFAKIKPARLNFLKLHWRQSSLSAIFAHELASQLQFKNVDEASFAARFLNLGELVLESICTDEYLLLHENANSESELLTAEVARFTSSHAEIGSDLLRSWGLSSGVCDALRYHHETLGAILDASPLVKLCWLANLMATEGLAESKVFAAGHRLFNLDKEMLIKIYTNGREQLQEKQDALDFKFSSVARLPLAFSAEHDAAAIASNEATLLEISMQVQGRSLCNEVPVKFSGQTDLSIKEQDKGAVLGEALSLLFGLQSAMVFCPAETGQVLLGWISSKAPNDVTELRIKCEQSRSLVAQCFISSDASQGAADDVSRTVVDRQILALLGMPAMVCDPIIVEGKVVAVLVVGVQQGQTDSYLQQLKVRAILKADIAASISEPGADLGSENLGAIYEQRIREAIHEANNPLSIIKNYLHLLSMKQGDDSSVLEEISVIKSEIDRVSGILAKLKNNADPEEAIVEIDINRTISDLNKVFSASIFSTKELRVELRLDPELPLIYSKENALKQILTNILKNATEALSMNGHLEISTCGNIYTNNRHYVQIMITDNGPGIPIAAMDTLFLPGNSTKGEGHSGSGLAIVKNLVDDLGGQISCQSNNNGTSFSFLLPKAMSAQARGNDNG